MEYHQPDDRWEIFGIKDFDTYQRDLVLKGLFHKNVPKDVTDSYVLCEYMMAHAYYHYPLFDEALSKLLRIIEMAVKLRCKELGISLETKKIKPKNKRPYKKTFSVLINDVDNVETAKKIKYALDQFRSLRNIFMHPEIHSFSGATVRNGIKFGIIILNMLFLPDKLFIEMGAEIGRIKTKSQSFNKDLLVLESKDKRILVEDIGIMGAIPLESGWQYFLVARPVLDIPDPKEFTYAVPITVEVSNIQFNEQQCLMKMIETGEIIIVSITEHPDYLAKLKKFQQLKNSLNKIDSIMWQQVVQMDIVKKKNEFWYKSLWKSVI